MNFGNEELIAIGEVKTKKKGKSVDVAERKRADVSPNSQAFLQHNLAIANLPPVDSNNPTQVADRVQKYFEICEDNNMKPSLPGLALAFGVSRETFKKWAVGAVQKGKDVVDILNRAVAVLDAQMTDYMQNNEIAPVNGIFLMKNHFDYRDQNDIVVTPNNPLGELDAKGLEQRYIDSIPEAAGDGKTSAGKQQ